VKHRAESKSAAVARVLEREIRSGMVGDGAPLASESALMQRFGVSRTTIRRGLEALTAKGLIQTMTGVGSFVTYGGAVLDSAAGWSVALSDRGTRLETRVLRIARIAMDLQAPNMAPDVDVLAVDRVRCRPDDGTGLTLERSRMPWRMEFNAILRDGLKGGSLSETMKGFGLSAVSGEEWANVVASLDAADAAQMHRPAHQPMLRLRRLTRNRAGGIFEFVETLLDPDLFGLHMEF
jgi:GntR family transcriptional regulator